MAAATLSLLMACGSGPSPTSRPPSASPAAAPPSPPTATPTQAPTQPPATKSPAEPPTEEPVRIDLSFGGASPGSYVADAGFAYFAFEVGEGWQHGGIVDDAGFFLTRDTEGTILTGTHFDGEVFSDPCDPAGDTTSIDSDPTSFLNYISTVDGLEVSNPIAMEVAGYDAMSVDLTTSIDCPPPGIAFLWTLPTAGDFHLVDDQQVRMVAIDTDSKTVVFIAEARTAAGTYDDLVAAMDEILATLTIRP